MLDRRLIFVTGKGGVGKTTIAAAIALLGAEHGRRTLVCEVDAKGNLAEFFETGTIGFEEREIQRNLWAMSMDTEASLKQYLSLQLKIPLVARIGPLAHTFDFVATAAPGVKEIVTVGKLCWEVKERHFDLVVVDAAPTGRIVSQLAAPRAINQLLQVGPVRQQTGWMLDLLGDPTVTGLVCVTTPEEMPVNETIELRQQIETETAVDLAAVVVNRVLPELFGRNEEEVFERLDQPDSTGVLDDVMDGPVQPLFDGARMAVTLRRTRTGHLERLRASIDPSIPMLYVPYLFMRAHGLRSIRQVAEAVSAELGY